MRIYSLYLFITLFIFGFSIKAQISITFPMEKAVFQRNESNQATINIAGNYTTPINSIEARIKNAFNDNVVIDWTAISAYLDKGIYHGSLPNVAGGWYKLEVRGKFNGVEVGTTTLNRVGVGEVFIIAGQSNAQGIEGDNGEVSASDERVLSHNEVSWYDVALSQCDKKNPNYPSFTSLQYNTSLSKTGFRAWCYGKLGDNLVSRLGVPVVFFNSGAVATSSLNWKESSDGLQTINHYSLLPYCNTSAVPYNALKKTINYYAAIFGIRAVLFHQGETDNFATSLNNASTYTSNINYVINKSRTNLGATIPWVISKASVFDKNVNGGLGNANPNIINAQNSLVNIGNKVFSGPSTDNLLGSNRSDHVHFYGAGLIELANRWNASLDTDFFNNATPIVAKTLPIVTISHHNGTEFRLTAPSGYANYKWVRTDIDNNDFEDNAEATTQILDRASGTYRCYVTDNQGNTTFTQPVTVQNANNICTTCLNLTYLSNLTPISASNGYGPIEIDKSSGQNAAGDGTTIKLKGVSYAKGIGTHANAEIKYLLNNCYGRFIADIGIDDEVNDATQGATVIFKVYKDNVLSYSSATLNKNSPTVRLNINVTNVNELKLEVNDAGDNFFADHADWAGARLHCIDTQAPNSPTSLVESYIGQNCATLTWASSTDNMEVEKYNIYQDGSLIGNVNAPITTFNVIGLSQLNLYTFIIKAVDYSGNESSQSNILEIVTLQNPFFSSSKKLINIGQSSSLLAFGCSGGTLNWSNNSTSNPNIVSPTVTTIYTVSCTVGTCTSIIAKDTVKVLPNCQTNYSLQKNKDNYGGSATNLTFRASQTISAINIISTQAKINYQAGKFVILLPGFQANAGTVFTTTIAGCVNDAETEMPSSSLNESQPADKPKRLPVISNKE